MEAEEAPVDAAPKRGARKPKKEEAKPKDDELKYIGYFYRPHAVTDLWKFELEDTDVNEDGTKKTLEECQKKITHVAAAG